MENFESENEKIKKEKSRVIILSIASNAALVIMKIIIGLTTGLVSILAEALHSANDLMASIIAYFGVKGSLKPPDKEHPYGHGKIEMITGWVENILILIIGIGIIHEGIKKLAHPQEHKDVWIGIIIMFVSGFVNLFVSSYLIKKGKELRSVGIEVDGEHLHADVITSFGIAGALLLLQITKWWWIDPVGAIFVGVWVIGIFIRLSNSLMHLAIDGGLNENEIIRIENLLSEFPSIKDHHKVRTRQSGSTIFIDMHIKVEKDQTVEQSHNITKEIETRLREMYKDVNVLIHVEPYYEIKKV